MDWQIQIEKKAQKSLAQIPNPYKDNIIEAVDKLENNPRTYNTKKLKGVDDLWRIRVQDYRIVYKVQDDNKVILVIRIAHRSDVYHNL